MPWPNPNKTHRGRLTLATMALTVVGLLFTSPLVEAEVYKWVDENGQAHYEEKKRPGSSPVKIRATPSQDKALLKRLSKRERMLQVLSEERDQRKALAMKQSEDKQKRAQHCTEAQKELSSYQQAARIYTLDANGNQVNLSDTQREDAIKQAQQRVKKYCS